MFWNSSIYPKCGSFGLLPLRGPGTGFVGVLPLPLIFDPPSIYTTFHYVHYISQRSNANNCFRITGYSIKIWSQVPTITQAILPQNQSLSVSKLIHKESGVVNRFLTAWQHVWTPWSERTYCMENGQSVFFLSPHTCKTLTPCFFCLYQFLYWFWEKNRLFCSLILLIRLQLTLY